MTNNPLVEALRILRDYVSDAANGTLTYADSGEGFIAMAKEDLVRIDAALASSAPATGEREQIVGWQRAEASLPPPNEGPSKEWCLRMAELEGDAEIGAGMPDHPLRDISPQGCQAESALIVAHGLLRSYSGTASDAGDAFKVLDAALRTQSGEMEGGEHG